MIEYNWKAEFVKGELELISYFRKKKNNNHSFQNPSLEEADCLSDYLPATTKLIAEMANALDRYETILNELEGDSNYDS